VALQVLEAGAKSLEADRAKGEMERCHAELLGALRDVGSSEALKASSILLLIILLRLFFA